MNRMLGRVWKQLCRYGCCSADMHDGKRNVVRRAKRREARAWRRDCG